MAMIENLRMMRHQQMYNFFELRTNMHIRPQVENCLAGQKAAKSSCKNDRKRSNMQAIADESFAGELILLSLQRFEHFVRQI